MVEIEAGPEAEFDAVEGLLEDGSHALDFGGVSVKPRHVTRIHGRIRQNVARHHEPSLSAVKHHLMTKIGRSKGGDSRQ